MEGIADCSPILAVEAIKKGGEIGPVPKITAYAQEDVLLAQRNGSDLFRRITSTVLYNDGLGVAAHLYTNKPEVILEGDQTRPVSVLHAAHIHGCGPRALWPKGALGERVAGLENAFINAAGGQPKCPGMLGEGPVAVVRVMVPLPSEWKGVISRFSVKFVRDYDAC